MKRHIFPLLLVTVASIAPQAASAQKAKYDEMVSRHARINGLPESLVHRVIVRESKYQPHLIGRGGAMGMMQIKLPTARGMGYTGSAQGLLDAETNVTYAVKYLAGAYRVAGGDHDRSVSYYARGYYYAAKRQGLLNRLSVMNTQASVNAHGAHNNPIIAASVRSGEPQQLVLVEKRRSRKQRNTPFIGPPRIDELTAERVSADASARPQ